ncbi:unnamed protein product [Schistosoma curassoni]|uniref:Secreted protein n=1 Tax=Schistosoma curassoni TaxID=6186 RepID=A0A183KM97_9TREM|nr:unnamed protein product [Schistosoma curassoni]
MHVHVPLIISFILIHRLLLYDLPFLSYTQSINYSLPHSQPLLARSCTNVIFYFMVRCGMSGLYINSVCLKYMIHISEAEIGVLDLTGRARQEAGPIRVYAPLMRSINRCSLIGGIITLYIHRA